MHTFLVYIHGRAETNDWAFIAYSGVMKMVPESLRYSEILKFYRSEIYTLVDFRQPSHP